MSELWNGADTGNSMPRFAPFAVAMTIARSTASRWPAMTICSGVLKLTASTTCPCAASAHAAATPALSSPRMAAIAPTPEGTASCIACARKRTSGTASWNASARAATSAVYSPRLCPAMTAGVAPPAACHARQTATPGCQHDRLRVDRLVERIFGSVGDERPEILSEYRRCLVEGRPYDRMILESGHHADRLRSLSRKHECDSHGAYQSRKTEPHVNPPPTPSSMTC